MLARILRSTIVLAAVIAAYQAYVLLAVPRMEPPLAVREQSRSTGDQRKDAVQAPGKYQRLLLNYFPANHWTQLRQPKVFANGTEQAMLVIDEYKRTPAGTDKEDITQLDIKQFVMIMFPTPPHGDVVAPRDAIVLESQQGAKLLIEDFHPEMGKIGQVLRGEFPGPILIRSDMHEPGPDDDLVVETSDLQMNTKLLYTTAPVRFRLGQNVGGGRELEIRFLPDEHAKSKDVGLKFAGFDTLEIRREVRMRMQFNTTSLVPGAEKDAKPNPAAQANNPANKVPAAPATPPVPKPPVDVVCTGPFTFDFVKYKASVDRDVVVRQLNLEGPADQLNCNELDIYFTPKELPPTGKADSAAGDPSKQQQRDLGRLEASTVIATGHPAIAISPARKIEARGDRIHIALREQRMRIEGGNDTRLTQGPNVLQAPLIDYLQPEKDSGTKIGRFRATGPGSLHYVSEEKRPDQIFQAAWQTSVQLGRDQGQPTIVMEGRPEVAFGAAGSLIADQIRLYLRELAGDSEVGMKIGSAAAAAGGPPSADDKKDQAKVAPDRMIAVGHVEIASPQMAARTQQLTANFQLQPADPPAVAAAAGAALGAPGAPAAGAVGKPSPAGAKQQPPGKADPQQQSYQVVADQMRLELFLKGQTAVPSTLACDGNIIVRGVQQPGDTQQPIEIRGQQVFVDKLDSKTPHVILRGAAIGNGATVKPISTGAAPALAQVTGHGVTLLTSTIEMETRDNKTWSDGPGEATVQMARDLQGNALTAPAPVKIRWRNGLRFDGQTVMFNENVVVASADSSLRCDRLLARLQSPLKVGEHVQQSASSFSQIDCEGQVLIENITRDGGGVTAHDRMQLGHLTINQQTGDIRGEGPGVIRSTRFGAGLGALGTPGTPAQPAGAASAAGNKLNFLRVDFHTGLDGNMYTRMLTFHDRVRTVYGPVDAWEQELDLTRPETLPMDSMTLSCDELRLNEDPAAPKAAPKAPGTGPKGMDAIQVNAQRNVKIDGQSAVQGQFSVQADRASYDKLKDLFILEGDTRTPARLWRRAPSGADSPPLEARKIYYSRTTNQVKVEGIQSFEFTPSDLEKTQRPKPGAPGVR